MTKAQETMYWRRWGAVARANRWRMVKGRLDEAAVLGATEAHLKVAAAAAAIALQGHRSITAEDLRHGCHVVACGRDMGHGRMGNKEFDQVLNYWGDERLVRGLLIEPLDLGSEIHRTNPGLKSRERHLWFLREECLMGYVASECQRIYGTKDLEGLGDVELAALSNHMRKRPHALKNSKAEIRDPKEDRNPKAEVETAGNPF